MSRGRVEHALVTGASGAIGGAIARELRARDPAVRLSLVDASPARSEALARELGGEARAIEADLADVDAIPALLDAARAAHGAVDGLVNCAGIMDVRRLHATPWDAAERLLRVDLLAPLRLLRECAPSMIARRSGFVVNVASMAGRVPLKGCAYYGAAKAGLAMASEIARAELAPRGVRVVTVYPGPVASALEGAARAQYAPGPLAAWAPTGDARALAARIASAIATGRARVVYPDWYELGYRAVGIASRVALALGPDPIA